MIDVSYWTPSAAIHSFCMFAPFFVIKENMMIQGTCRAHDEFGDPCPLPHAVLRIWSDTRASKLVLICALLLFWGVWGWGSWHCFGIVLALFW